MCQIEGQNHSFPPPRFCQEGQLPLHSLDPYELCKTALIIYYLLPSNSLKAAFVIAEKVNGGPGSAGHWDSVRGRGRLLNTSLSDIFYGAFKGTIPPWKKLSNMSGCMPKC